jgi:hypothetical protein
MKPDQIKRHQRRSTRFSEDGCTALVQLRVDRRHYEFARGWAAFHALGDPLGTAEDHLEGTLNLAIMSHIGDLKWTAPPEIEALFPRSEERADSDMDDDIPF